jgi:hypothetical protein
LACSLLKLGLGVAAAVGLLGGCFSTPVNMRPAIAIKSTTSRVYRGQTAVFAASATDPDGDLPQVEWQWTTGSCPVPPNDPAAWRPPATLRRETTFMVTAEATRSPFCVWALATDAYGAVALDTLEVEPDNHAPVASIDVLAPTMTPVSGFPLHTMFTLSSARSMDADATDNDKLGRSWFLTVGQGERTRMPDCASATKPTDTCFQADVAGNYDVELDVTDGIDVTVAHHVLFVAPGTKPVAKIVAVSPTNMPPFPLGTAIELSGLDSFDPDSDRATFEYGWDLVDKPIGSAASLEPCIDEGHRCLKVDLPGPYDVKLAVTAEGEIGVDTYSFYVLPDQPPCIDTVTPAAVDFVPVSPTTGADFSVDRVRDDLDPFPQDGAIFDATPFQWTLFDTAGNALFPATNAATFHIPGNVGFLPGQDLRLRLDIRDRDVQRATQELSSCQEETCSLNHDACLQRLTWHVKIL